MLNERQRQSKVDHTENMEIKKDRKMLSKEEDEGAPASSQVNWGEWRA